MLMLQGGGNDGTSWSNAYTDLQSALGAAGNGDQIWLAEGTYTPTDGEDREISFVIPSGVEIYGGFAGGENSINARDYVNNETILSGNIGEDEAGDNSYHVVDITGTTASTILDGLTISDGNANGRGGFRRQDDGAGLFSRENSGAVLRNLILTNNVASGDGGALYLENNNSPTVVNVIFNNNSASNNGGAIYVDSNSTSNSLNIFNSLFVDNQSSGGGAIHTDFIIALNIINNTFYNNQGGDGDDFFDGSSFGEYDRTINNNIFADDAAIDRAKVVLSDLTSEVNLTISNNIIKGNSPLPGEEDISGEGNITEDPLFIDPENNDFRLQTNSPGIDAGDNDAINLDEDIANNPRIFNDTVDIGAYEYGLLMSIDDVTLTEGDEDTTNAEFTVTLLDTLDEPTTEEITVNYTTQDDSATADSDYATTGGTLVFNAGESSKIISVPVNGDELIESNERFSVVLSGLIGNAEIVDTRGFATITNDDQRREITISDASIEEGDEEEQAIEFTVSLNEAYVENITVDYDLVENLALPDEDYIDTDGTLTFEPGETEKIISIDVIGDTSLEADETFFVQLSNPSNTAEFTDSRGTATIENNDIEPVNISIDDVVTTEGDEENTTIEFTVSLDEASSQTVTVDYELNDSSATVENDYTDDSGTITFEPGETEQTISVSVVADTEIEENETFFVNLSNPSSNAEFSDARGIGTITNDDEIESLELFRFRNTTFASGTYIFVGEEEKEGIENNPDLNRTFKLEGVQEDGTVDTAFKASITPGEGLIPFFRLRSLQTSGTFLFVSTEEYNAIFAEDSDQKDNWEKEGLDAEENDIPEFYLYGRDENIGIDFNRFQNLQNGTFLYAGPEESAAIIENPELSEIFINQGGAFESLI